MKIIKDAHDRARSTGIERISPTRRERIFLLEGRREMRAGRTPKKNSRNLRHAHKAKGSGPQGGPELELLGLRKVRNMGRLTGKIAVITGGNSGIGLATAKRFVSEGAYVFITGRRQDELDKAVAILGSGVTGVQGDVSNLDDLDRLFATVQAEKGHVDVMFANAGIGGMSPLGTVGEDQYDKVFDVNVKGTLFSVQKALPLMPAGGSIILTGSTTGSMGTPAFSVYSATKAAIRNFARSWALDLKGTGSRGYSAKSGA